MGKRSTCIFLLLCLGYYGRVAFEQIFQTVIDSSVVPDSISELLRRNCVLKKMTAIAYSHCNQALSMVYQSLQPSLMKNVQQEHKRGADPAT